MTDGFLGRWSQRKQAVRAGKVVAESVNKPAPAVPDAATANDKVDAVRPDFSPNGVASTQTLKSPAESSPLPTLLDVQRLTTESDFSPFVARDVAPEVRNAAMKKLFADPHYNVMDRLDIYIDDYSKPDPLPASMLRKMVSAKFLNLFEEEKTPQLQLRDDPDSPSVHSVAQSAPSPKPDIEPAIENQPREQNIDHDHPDLQLQPNHAAGCPGPGRSAQ